MAKDIEISSCENLLVRINVIGYPQKGESVVCFFVDALNGRVLYSIVIDSFKYYGKNKTIDLLNKYGIDKQKIDVLCWSHPDFDHSLGLIDIINGYCNENTKYLVPKNLFGKDCDQIKYNKQDRQIIGEISAKFSIYKKGRKKKFSYITIETASHGANEVISFDFFHANESIPISLIAYAPISNHLNDRIINHRIIKKNELSIFLVLMVGSYKFIFGGDTENEAIESIKEDVFNDVVFIKIPHHSSKTSNLLPLLINSNQTIACTTIYKTMGLPDSCVIDLYKSKVEQLDSTGNARKGERYGVVQYDFDLFNQKVVKIIHRGHAEKIK